MAAKEELCWCGWLRTNGKPHTHNPNFNDGFIPAPTAVPSRDEDKSE